MSGKSRIEELQEEVERENAAEESLTQSQPVPPAPPVPPVSSAVSVTPEALASAIVQASEISSGVRRKIPYGQQRIHSPFNPTGNRHRELKRHVYQNGYRLNIKLLHDPEIDLLNNGQIVPGRYIDKLITVRVEDEDDGTSAMHFDYKNRTADQRMSLGMRLGSGGGQTGFENMLRLIIKEIAQNAASAKARRQQEVQEALA